MSVERKEQGADSCAAPCYAWGDKCPDCGKPMDCDEGQRMTRQEPEIRPCVYCPDCGTEYPMTHNDQAQRSLPDSDAGRKE
jgi:hypothetical protein